MPLKNKEKRKQYNRKYYLKNREIFCRNSLNYYYKNKERISKGKKEERRQNTNKAEKERESRRKSYHRNKKEWNEYRKNRYGILRNELLKRIGNTCIVCGLKRRITFHEIHGKPHGHNPDQILKHIEDFIPLCYSCHATVHVFAKYRKKIGEIARQIV